MASPLAAKLVAWVVSFLDIYRLGFRVGRLIGWRVGWTWVGCVVGWANGLWRVVELVERTDVSMVAITLHVLAVESWYEGIFIGCNAGWRVGFELGLRNGCWNGRCEGYLLGWRHLCLQGLFIRRDDGDSTGCSEGLKVGFIVEEYKVDCLLGWFVALLSGEELVEMKVYIELNS